MATETAAGKPLTDLEQRLVDYVTCGELLDLAGGEPGVPSHKIWSALTSLTCGGPDWLRRRPAVCLI